MPRFGSTEARLTFAVASGTPGWCGRLLARRDRPAPAVVISGVTCAPRGAHAPRSSHPTSRRRSVTHSVLESPGAAAVPSELGPSSLGLSSLVGQSAALRAAIDLSRAVAADRTTAVLLAGETETGGEQFAQRPQRGRSAHSGPDAAPPTRGAGGSRVVR